MFLKILCAVMSCGVMSCDTQQEVVQEVVILRYFHTHATLSSKKYPVVITQGRIFIGGVVVNSSKANILDAL